MSDVSRMSPVDRGRYYKGLLVLARRDHRIHDREREFVLELGRALDFDARFCESAVAELLRNRHVTDDPVKFTALETALAFLRDGVRLALVDDEISRKELSWLRSVASANGVPEEWLEAAIRGGG